jgi:hypothetical protein
LIGCISAECRTTIASPFHLGSSPHLLAQIIAPLFSCTYELQVSHPFVLTFIQNAGACTPSKSKNHEHKLSKNPPIAFSPIPAVIRRVAVAIRDLDNHRSMISDSVNPFIYHPCGKLLRKILSEGDPSNRL